MKTRTFTYKGAEYPNYLKEGNATFWIAPFAEYFCKGNGIDIGAGRWPLDGAGARDKLSGDDVYALTEPPLDYVYSSHCLEHLEDPIRALEHWISLLKPGGCLFLYLPHPDMVYWRPENCRKHLHTWLPRQMFNILSDLGIGHILLSERDLLWSFAVVGYKGHNIG